MDEQLRISLDRMFSVVYDRILDRVNFVKGREEKQELLSFTILDLYERSPKGLEKSLRSEKDFINFFCGCMFNNYKWQKHKPNKKDQHLTLFQETDSGDSDEENSHHDPYNNDHEFIYLEAENTDEKTKDYIKDLLNQDLPYDKIQKLFRLPEIIAKLSPSDKIFYQMSFVEGMSSREISKKLSEKIKIPHTEVWYRIKFIRNFIHEEIKKQK